MLDEIQDVVDYPIDKNSTYTGSIIKGTTQMHGFGVLETRSANGEINTYEGDWIKGSLHYGRHSSSSNFYEGNFDEKLRYNGFGILNYLKGPHEGSIYIGNWEHDRKEGLGRWMKKDGIDFGIYHEGILSQQPGANYRVGDNIYGIDLSHWQKNVDWNNLALFCDKDGNVFRGKPDSKRYMQPVFFVYLKATEGSTVQDAMYTVRMKEATRHGVIKGSYHFLRLRDIDSQIQNFLEYSNWSYGDLPPALDVEIDCDNIEMIRSMAYKWLVSVERALKVRPIIYTTEKYRNLYFRNDTRFLNYDFWIARFSNQSPVNNGWVVWQQSESGMLSGSNDQVDINLYKGNYEAFQNYITIICPKD